MEQWVITWSALAMGLVWSSPIETEYDIRIFESRGERDLFISKGNVELAVVEALKI
jgi:hypothetical protein